MKHASRSRARANARLASALAVAGTACLAPALAQTPPPQAAACATCHGEQGLSRMPGTPHLAGQPDVYLREQLKAYRSGARRHEVMAVIAKPLTDDDISTLAAYYSTFEIQLKGRP